MRRGYYDQKGNFVETSKVVNAFANFNKPLPQHGWLCDNGHQMKLYPISHDEPVEYWECPCKRITIQERDELFIGIIDQTKQQYQLKTLEYNRENHYFDMVSNRWIGEDRIAARRYEIKATESREIKDHILDELQSRLGISIDRISEYFNEG